MIFTKHQDDTLVSSTQKLIRFDVQLTSRNVHYAHAQMQLAILGTPFTHHMMQSIILLLSLLPCFCFPRTALANTLHVGAGHPYTTMEEAALIAIPGDTILVHQGIYNGGVFFADLQGLPDAWIYIIAASGEDVVFEGGTNAWQFSDAAYLHISGFTFRHQTGNGLNFDDGGTYDTPAHHVIFHQCTFRDINASGNNDLLKLSGLDSFEIRNCVFINGSPGGSGIDMVGCHDGIIVNSTFEDLGSNAVQAKGGTSNIRIEGNFFRNAGARALNLGGSTGLQFFRPIDATYEAAYLKVYSNIFTGSEAPIAFVGALYCEVVNNTFYLPGKWAMRILQETVDESRFPPCGYNTYRNNIVYIDDRVSVEVNIGPNTAPETFTFSNNLWYHADDVNWPGPTLPVPDLNNIVQEDPLFEDPSADNFNISDESPAIQNGFSVFDPQLDFDGDLFQSPPSIGAQEGNLQTKVTELYKDPVHFEIFPNPASGSCTIVLNEYEGEACIVDLKTPDGKIAATFIERVSGNGIIMLALDHLMQGIYIMSIQVHDRMAQTLFIKVQ